jgi:hypothetical protein
MTTPAGNQALGDSLFRRLQVHEFRLQDPQTAYKVYQDFLTDDERKQIGPLEEAYSHSTDRTIGIWMRVKGVGRHRAIVDLSRKFGLPDGDYESLLRDIGESRTLVLQTSSLPVWNRDRRELLLDAEVLKRIDRLNRAVNQVTILDAFQEDGWPSRIDDPLPPSTNSRRLADTVRRLNERLLRIHFSRDGTGEGIRWEYVRLSK